MDTLDRKAFIIALRLPLDLYTLFNSDCQCKGDLTLNIIENSLQIQIPESTNSSSKIYKADIIKSDEAYLFTVDKHKKARFKGKIHLQGRLQAEESEILQTIRKLNIKKEIKSNIVISESAKENINPKSFKLHEFHDLFSMGDQEQAIKKTVREKYGQCRKRGEELEVMNNIILAFRKQKYWSIKKIADELGQPDNFIRELVKKVAIKVKMGPNRQMYTLLENEGKVEEEKKVTDDNKKE
ncbi:hypothetical protein SteCoe_3431 [Stentor coeruleus]|uniref:TFIIF beta subunit HTH domain-containing protein n=1 Tax=Stentor coeruleus TaxID=5963 RepID=A0A1R2CX93_9CILI|nr:hypothetical protein SteCoe_3431 [Stentor coeruleus]